MFDEIKSMIEEQGDAFDAFKANFEQKFEAERKERERLEAQLNRGTLGGGGNTGATAEEIAHKKAFIDGFVRKGREGDLAQYEGKTLSVGSDPDGGYAVPDILNRDIEQLLVDLSPMRRIARVVQVGGGQFQQLVNAGGTSSGWVGETESRPVTDGPSLKKISPPMGEIYSQPQVTQQLLDDAMFDVESWLSEEIAQEFSVEEGQAFITGTGNKPRGLLSGDFSTDGDTTRTFGELQYITTGVNGAFPTSDPADKLIDLVHTLRPVYRANATWLMSPDTLQLIRKFKNGSGDYIWQPALTAGQPSTLLGYPVVEDTFMPDPDTDSLSIVFGDFRRGYMITDRQGPRMLRDPYTSKPYVKFYTTKRVGGMLLNDQALKVLKFGTS